MPEKVDIFTLEILANALNSIAEEMFWTAIRTAKSSIFYETLDFSTAITRWDGETVAQAVGIPLFIGVMDFSAKHMMREAIQEYGKVEPGDILISNDPYSTGTHLNDVALSMPIFCKGKLIGIAVAKGHINDIGGMNPGSWGPGSSEIYQEGLFIPTVKYYVAWERNPDVVKLIKANSRIPEYIFGDLEALAAALRLAYRRVNELADKYGLRAVEEAMNYVIDRGEVLARKKLEKLPKGEFTAEDFLDDSGETDEPLKIKVKVKITGRDFVADFSDNPSAVRAPINTTYPATVAAVRIVYIATLDPHLSYNNGIVKPLKVIAPEGTIFNAKKPYPVSVYWETLTYAADLVWRALAPHLPHKLTAGHFLSVVAETIAGVDPRTGEYFVLVEPNPGGWGAAHDRDGESGLVSFADGETYATSVEVAERKFPIIVERYELNTADGTGHGKFRGGFGIVKDYRLYADEASFTTAVNRARFPPWGLEGGCDGTVNYMTIIRNGKELMRVRRIVNFTLKKGDIVSIRSGGGGGWGNPLERDPELVLWDVINEYITPEVARNVYGVVIDLSSRSVDYEATRKLREELRKAKANVCLPSRGLESKYVVLG